MEKSKKNKWVAAEIQLIYKSRGKISDRPNVISSKTAYEIFLDNWNDGTIELVEEFKVMLLNNQCRLMGIYDLSKGSHKGTVVTPKYVFASAIKCNAASIILAHNHPSGGVKPSSNDIQLTKNMEAGGRLLGIPVDDHIIVTREGYFSFANEGLL